MSCDFAAKVRDVVFVWICFDGALLSDACGESGCVAQFAGIAHERGDEIGGCGM